SVLGAAFYVLLGDWLSTLWPRWLLLLGVVLMVVSLGLQRGLWGLGESLWSLLRRKGGGADAQRNGAASQANTQGGQA
ncbi:MAG: branched-chain amino acid ABC transporter permease, partial [Diaphorobacter nitroreducens]